MSMKPYIVDVVDKSNVSESIKGNIANDVPNSLDNSIRDTQLIQPHTLKPTVKYLFKDDLKDTKYSNEYIVDDIIQHDEQVKKIIILDVEENRVTTTKQYNIRDDEATHIAHIEVSDSTSGNSKIIRIETAESNLKGLDKLVPSLGSVGSLHMLELFDDRNRQLLDILRYNNTTS